MKKVFSVLLAAMLAIVPMVFAVDIGGGIGVDITTEDFEPIVWLCDNRVVRDDAVEPGRISEDDPRLVERINNYAFEGESIEWDVVVFDKNGREKISDVYVTLGSTQGTGNDIEANCDEVNPYHIDFESCNARILEERIYEIDPEVMVAYKCILTVETPNSMQGEYFITVEAEDMDGLLGAFAENEYWFLNPEIALSLSDSVLDFGDNVRPGTQSYSQTILVGNDAEPGSGVMLDMFISGTDFYDPASSGAKCPISNTLLLDAFDYYVTNGAYSSYQDGRKDSEGYIGIGYGDHFDASMYGTNEILQAAAIGPYYAANVLAPGAEMAITFRLSLPEPCNGDFSDGDIFFWAEAI